MASAFAASKIFPMMERAISGEKTTGACWVFAWTAPKRRKVRRGAPRPPSPGGFPSLGGRLLIHIAEVEAQIPFQLAELFALGQAGEGIFAGDAGKRDGAVDELA